MSSISHPFKSKREITKLGILIFAFLIFFLIRSWLPLDLSIGDYPSTTIRTGLAIFILAAVLWLSEALPLPLTSILIAVLSALTGVMNVTASFSGFAHPLIFLFLGGFGLAAALSKQGLDRWLAMKILTLGNGRFYLTATILFLCSALLSMWISNTATVALLLPVALGILRNLSLQCGEKISEKVAPYLLLGIAYSASIGGMGTLIGSPPNAIAAAQLGINFTEWMKFGLPIVVIALPMLFICLRLLANPGVVKLSGAKPQHFTLTSSRLLTLIIFLIAIVGWLFSAQLSELLNIKKSFDTIIAVSAILLLAICRLVDWKDIDRTTNWGVLLLFGGGITLSKILGATGASYFLASQIQSLSSGWPVLMLVALVVLFVVFLTELSSNTASAALLVPIFATVAMDMNLPASHLVLPLAFAASCAFMLPVATPPNAIVFGTGKIQQRDMLRIGLVLNFIFIALLTGLSLFI